MQLLTKRQIHEQKTLHIEKKPCLLTDKITAEGFKPGDVLQETVSFIPFAGLLFMCDR